MSMTHTHRLQRHDVPKQTVNPDWEKEKLKTAALFIVIAMKTFAPKKPIRDSGGKNIKLDIACWQWAS